MASFCARITRFIASILAMALSVQIVAAQGGNCVQMSTSQGAAAHQEMHHSGFDEAKAATEASQTPTPPIPGCSQSILCMNATAMVDLTMGTGRIAHLSLPIACSPGTLEARVLCPDSPPPKI